MVEPLNRWRRGGNRSTGRKPLATSFRKCHILQPEDSSPKRDSNPLSSIGGRLGKQTCQPLHQGEEWSKLSSYRCSKNFCDVGVLEFLQTEPDPYVALVFHPLEAGSEGHHGNFQYWLLESSWSLRCSRLTGNVV